MVSKADTTKAEKKASELYNLLFDEKISMMFDEYVTKVSEVADHLGLKIVRVDFKEFFKNKQDILVYIESNGVSGFLVKSKRLIVVNRLDIIERQRFTIAHEIGHFLLGHIDGDSLSIAFRDNTTSTGKDPKEVEANTFAAELLMPKKMVNRILEKTNSLPELANIFGVSERAMRYRLGSLKD